MPRDFGTVEAGMRTDLLLLDANPLEAIANLSKRVGVMACGRWPPESELRKMLEMSLHSIRNSSLAYKESYMKHIITTAAAAALVMALCIAVASAKADFSGTWILDKTKSEGLPPGLDQHMTVVHTGDKLKLETKLINEEGERVVSDSYTLDGKETEFTPQTPNGPAGKGKRTAKWSADGNGIEVTENSTFDGPEGPVSIQMTRLWTLSADGKTLKIDLTADGPNGKQQVKRTFVKK